MGTEAFRPFRQAKEEVADKTEDFLQRRLDIKNERLIEHLKHVEGVWKDGPVTITLEPAYFKLFNVNQENLQSSDELAAKYPALASVLWSEDYTRVSPLILGRIDVGQAKRNEEGESKKYMTRGKDVITAGVDLLKDVEHALREAAYAIQRNERPLSDVDYIVGISRLGSVAGHFGFDMFALSDKVERNHQSHKYAEQANILAGKSAAEAEKLSRKRPATLAVISTKKLVELYGN